MGGWLISHNTLGILFFNLFFLNKNSSVQKDDSKWGGAQIHKLVGGWTNPFEKIWTSNLIISPRAQGIGVKVKNIWVATTKYTKVVLQIHLGIEEGAAIQIVTCRFQKVVLMVILILLMVQKSPGHPPFGCIKNLANHGINYQSQLVIAGVLKHQQYSQSIRIPVILGIWFSSKSLFILFCLGFFSLKIWISIAIRTESARV